MGPIFEIGPIFFAKNIMNIKLTEDAIELLRD